MYIPKKLHFNHGNLNHSKKILIKIRLSNSIASVLPAFPVYPFDIPFNTRTPVKANCTSM